MCGYMEGLVETSCNLGITKLTPEDFQGFASVRSSVATEKKALADKIAYLTEFFRWRIQGRWRLSFLGVQAGLQTPSLYGGYL